MTTRTSSTPRMVFSILTPLWAAVDFNDHISPAANSCVSQMTWTALAHTIVCIGRMVDDGEPHRPIAPWSPYRHPEGGSKTLSIRGLGDGADLNCGTSGASWRSARWTRRRPSSCRDTPPAPSGRCASAASSAMSVPVGTSRPSCSESHAAAFHGWRPPTTRRTRPCLRVLAGEILD